MLPSVSRNPCVLDGWKVERRWPIGIPCSWPMFQLAKRARTRNWTNQKGFNVTEMLRKGGIASNCDVSSKYNRVRWSFVTGFPWRFWSMHSLDSFDPDWDILGSYAGGTLCRWRDAEVLGRRIFDEATIATQRRLWGATKICGGSCHRWFDFQSQSMSKFLGHQDELYLCIPITVRIRWFFLAESWWMSLPWQKVASF